MTRTMYDSIPATAPSIPHDAAMVAGYVDGYFAWPADLWAKFPNAAHVRISVEPFEASGVTTGYPHGNWPRASVIDVELGAFNPADAGVFVRERNAFRPGSATVYASKATVPQVLRAARGHRYWLWLAWYVFHVPDAAEVAALEAELGLEAYGVALAAWQHTPGPLFDTSLVLAKHWHQGQGA